MCAHHADFPVCVSLVDDALTILMAFHSPEFEVIGLTTTFGNATTPICTRNALHLVCVISAPTCDVHYYYIKTIHTFCLRGYSISVKLQDIQMYLWPRASMNH